VLGAQIAEYLVNFYGPMSDSINSHDESDRLVVAWPTAADAPAATAPDGARLVRVATPDDIVVLRRTDHAEAGEWRRRVRSELAPLLDRGGVVTDFTRDGEYVVAVTD
jgi:predicted GNAT superfamily acetyltransferase